MISTILLLYFLSALRRQQVLVPQQCQPQMMQYMNTYMTNSVMTISQTLSQCVQTNNQTPNILQFNFNLSTFSEYINQIADASQATQQIQISFQNFDVINSLSAVNLIQNGQTIWYTIKDNQFIFYIQTNQTFSIQILNGFISVKQMQSQQIVFQLFGKNSQSLSLVFPTQFAPQHGIISNPQLIQGAQFINQQGCLSLGINTMERNDSQNFPIGFRIEYQIVNPSLGSYFNQNGYTMTFTGQQLTFKGYQLTSANAIEFYLNSNSFLMNQNQTLTICGIKGPDNLSIFGLQPKLFVSSIDSNKNIIETRSVDLSQQYLLLNIKQFKNENNIQKQQQTVTGQFSLPYSIFSNGLYGQIALNLKIPQQIQQQYSIQGNSNIVNNNTSQSFTCSNQEICSIVISNPSNNTEDININFYFKTNYSLYYIQQLFGNIFVSANQRQISQSYSFEINPINKGYGLKALQIQNDQMWYINNRNIYQYLAQFSNNQAFLFQNQEIQNSLNNQTSQQQLSNIKQGFIFGSSQFQFITRQDIIEDKTITSQSLTQQFPFIAEQQRIQIQNAFSSFSFTVDNLSITQTNISFNFNLKTNISKNYYIYLIMPQLAVLPNIQLKGVQQNISLFSKQIYNGNQIVQLAQAVSLAKNQTIFSLQLENNKSFIASPIFKIYLSQTQATIDQIQTVLNQSISSQNNISLLINQQTNQNCKIIAKNSLQQIQCSQCEQEYALDSQLQICL